MIGFDFSSFPFSPIHLGLVNLANLLFLLLLTHLPPSLIKTTDVRWSVNISVGRCGYSWSFNYNFFSIFLFVFLGKCSGLIGTVLLISDGLSRITLNPGEPIGLDPHGRVDWAEETAR